MTAIAARTERTYLAGLGASGALIAAATVAALFLAALVAFNGWPGSESGNSSEVRTAEVGPAASQAASTALAAAPGAVTATATPVVLADAGNPNSVVSNPNAPVPGGTTGPATSIGTSTPISPTQPGQNTGLGGGASDTVSLAANSAIGAPLVSTVGQTVSSVGGTVTTVLNNTPQILTGTLNALGYTLTQTLGVVGGTVNGLLAPKTTP